MKLTVVLAAYNGANFLNKQINTIIGQTRTPDEVLIVDDCSNDSGKTVGIVKEYCNEYGYIKFISNDTNKGWQRNFIEAAKNASGDIVFFSDQDDIWRENKLEVMMNIMESEDIPILVSNYDLINQYDEIIQKHPETGSLTEEKFSKKFMETVQLGCTMAVRKDIIEKYSYLWVDKFPHDNFFSLIGFLFEKIHYIDKCLILHRIHNSNNSGKRTFSVKKRVSIQIVRNAQLKKIIEDEKFQILDNKKKKIVMDYLEWGENRVTMLVEHSIIKWIHMLSYDISFYPTPKAFIGDLFTLRNNKNEYN